MPSLNHDLSLPVPAAPEEGPANPTPVQTAASLHDAPIALDAPRAASFQECLKALRTVDQDWQAGKLTPVAHRDRHEVALQEAFGALAAMHGANLRLPLHANSNNEVLLIARNPDGLDETMHGCGQFRDFAALLTPHNPRTGEKPGAIMIPENGWCWLKHHAIEKIVMEAAARLEKPAPPPEVEAPIRKYTDPVWVDHDYGTRGEFRGAKPTWTLDGKTFCGPTLIPEILTPRTMAETKQAKAVLFQLWHWATQAAAGTNANGHYLGQDEQGRHRIA